MYLNLYVYLIYVDSPFFEISINLKIKIHLTIRDDKPPQSENRDAQ